MPCWSIPDAPTRSPRRSCGWRAIPPCVRHWPSAGARWCSRGTRRCTTHGACWTCSATVWPSVSSSGDRALTFTRWPAWVSVVALAVLAKGFAFLREPVIAAAFGAHSSADAYYLAVGLPFLFYNLLGVPFSLWVTARMAAGAGGAAGAADAAGMFYRRSLSWGF